MRILRLLGPRPAEEIYTWGAATWSTISGPALAYETEAGSLAVRLHSGQPRLYPFSGTEPLPTSSERDLRWELVSSLTLWFVWCARCHRVFEGQLEPSAVTVRAIWLELIHTLRGQLDRIQGSSEKAERRRQAFHQTWQAGPFYTLQPGRVCWHYRPPVWLFPPPIV